MKIGIDIDDTITNTSQIALQCIRENQDQFGEIEQIDEKLKLLMRGIFPEELKAYYDANVLKILDSVTVKENAQAVINELKQKGHQIYIITSRSNERLGCDAYTYTQKFLQSQNIYCDRLFINAGDKLKQCQENGIDVMIDDSAYICQILEDHGIHAILFNSTINATDDVPLTRVNSWNEIKQCLLGA